MKNFRYCSCKSNCPGSMNFDYKQFCHICYPIRKRDHLFGSLFLSKELRTKEWSGPSGIRKENRVKQMSNDNLCFVQGNS